MDCLKYLLLRARFIKLEMKSVLEPGSKIIYFFCSRPYPLCFPSSVSRGEGEGRGLHSRFEDSICKKEVGEIGEYESKGGRIRANDLI